MDIRTRLDEIRAEAEALRDAEPTAEVVAQLKTLLAEKADLQMKLDAADAIEALTEPVPAPVVETEAVTVAEGDGEDEEAAPAEGGDEDGDDASEDAGDAAADDTEGDEADAEGEAIVDTDQLAEAIAASTVRDTPRANTGQKFRPRLVASSNMESLSVGTPMTATMMQSVHRMADSGRYNGRHVFASMNRWEPGARAVSSRYSAIENMKIMAAAESRAMNIAAAACFCGPDEAVKTIAACGVDGRPVADLFRSVPVSGRFNYVKPLPISDVAGGIAIWDCADQDAVDRDDAATWKPCIDLDCQDEVNVEPYLIPVCGTFTTQQQLSHPELIDEFLRKLAIAQDRIAETKLLDEIRASSHVFTVDTGQGILSQLVHIIGQLADVTPYGNRLDQGGYVLVVPNGTVEKLVADQHLRGAQDGLRRDTILAMLADIGVSRIVEAHEADTAANAAYSAATAALPALGVPTAYDPATNSVGTVPFYLFNPDAYSHGMSDIVEAGFVRDAALTRQNRTQYFLEGAEYLEKVNCHPSFVLEITACPTGTATQLGDAPLCS